MKTVEKSTDVSAGMIRGRSFHGMVLLWLILPLACLLPGQARAVATENAACASTAMTLDGQLTEPAWNLASWKVIPNTNCIPGTGCGSYDTTAWGQFKTVWNATALWIAVQVSDPGVLYANPAAPGMGRASRYFST